MTTPITTATLSKVWRSGLGAGVDVFSEGVSIDQRPQSSSASRLIAGAAGFLTLTQQSARPERMLILDRRLEFGSTSPAAAAVGRVARGRSGGPGRSALFDSADVQDCVFQVHLLPARSRG